MSKIKISGLLLDFLNDAAHLSITLMSSRNAAYELFREQTRPYSVSKSVTYLKSKKYIRAKTINNEEVIEITPLGRKRVFKFHYDYMQITPPKKWDGKWRIVIFDIPEKKKQVRHSINLKLKELGFIALQKSTFTYPYECRKEIEFIKNHFYLKKEVSYILAEEIDREEELKQKFNLKQ